MVNERVEEAWWTQIPEEVFGEGKGEHFWNEPKASVEISICMPETKRGMTRAVEDLGGYFVNQLKRRAVEVSEKRLTPKELEQFREAKHKEVTNYIAAQAFEAVPPELRPSKEQAIGMRWILTWKQNDDGSYKAKARAILKGYQDPQYEYLATTTPVMTRQTRQLLLQVAAWKRWGVKKGDVSGAFLQGRQYPNELYCVPCPEILKAMGLGPEEIVKVKKGCYGLVDAPLEWYLTVSEYLKEEGLVKSWSDPCCWLWKPKGVLRGIIAGHVDDFLFCGNPKDPEWLALEKRIQTRFKWGEWEEGNFTQCGVKIERQNDGSYHLSQQSYLDKVSEICLSSGRRKQTKEETTEREKTQLRGLLGALSWYGQQCAPHLSASVGLLLSEVTESTVETIVRANKLLFEAKQRKDHKLIIHAFDPQEKLSMFCWADAAGQNRRDGSSTQGIFIGMAPERQFEGHVEKVSPIGWHSSKIDRVSRSPGAAEARSVISGEDYLFHARFQLGEFFDPNPNVFDVDRTVNRVPGCLVSDSRNVYDKLQTEELSIKGQERRVDLELLSLKSAQRNNEVRVRWVHSEAQLGNALTKPGAKELELYYQMKGSWRIVNDPKMRSARKRRSDGLETLENHAQTTQTAHKTYNHERQGVYVCPTEKKPKEETEEEPGG